jgi:hypothetical protein
MQTPTLRPPTYCSALAGLAPFLRPSRATWIVSARGSDLMSHLSASAQCHRSKAGTLDAIGESGEGIWRFERAAARLSPGTRFASFKKRHNHEATHRNQAGAMRRCDHIGDHLMASYIAMALIWSASVAACRAVGSSRMPQPIQHPIRCVDKTEPAQFVDTEATWWSV